MSDEFSPRRRMRKIDSTADAVTSDDARELLSPQLLEEFDDDDSPSDEVMRLLEENARLRALAVELSNLLGNLPHGEWGATLTSADAIRSIRRKVAT
jgi:hypothetical protein